MAGTHDQEQLLAQGSGVEEHPLPRQSDGERPSLLQALSEGIAGITSLLVPGSGR